MTGKPQQIGLGNVRVPVDLRAALEQLATRDDRSVSAVVRIALTQYVESETGARS